jgi:hypothetical protein
MRSFLCAFVAALALTSGVAIAQTQTETTTTQSTTVPAVPPVALVPPAGTLSTTRETHAVDGYGNQVDSRQTSYRNSNGVAEDSRTTTTNVPLPPPPPPVSTTTTTTESTSTVPR